MSTIVLRYDFQRVSSVVHIEIFLVVVVVVKFLFQLRLGLELGQIIKILTAFPVPMPILHFDFLPVHTFHYFPAMQGSWLIKTETLSTTQAIWFGAYQMHFICVASMCILNNFTAPLPATKSMNCACFKVFTWFSSFFFIIFFVFCFCFTVSPCLQTLFEISLRHISGCSLSMKVFHNL